MVVDDQGLLANMKASIRRLRYEVCVTTCSEEGLDMLQSLHGYMAVTLIVTLIFAKYEVLKQSKEYRAGSFLNKPFALSGLKISIEHYFSSV